MNRREASLILQLKYCIQPQMRFEWGFLTRNAQRAHAYGGKNKKQPSAAYAVESPGSRWEPVFGYKGQSGERISGQVFQSFVNRHHGRAAYMQSAGFGHRKFRLDQTAWGSISTTLILLTARIDCPWRQFKQSDCPIVEFLNLDVFLSPGPPRLTMDNILRLCVFSTKPPIN